MLNKSDTTSVKGFTMEQLYCGSPGCNGMPSRISIPWASELYALPAKILNPYLKLGIFLATLKTRFFNKRNKRLVETYREY